MTNTAYNYFNHYQYRTDEAAGYMPEKLNAQRSAMARTRLITLVLTIVLAVLTVKMAGKMAMVNAFIPYLGTILTVGLGCLTIKIFVVFRNVGQSREEIAELLSDYHRAHKLYLDRKAELAARNAPAEKYVPKIDYKQGIMKAIANHNAGKCYEDIYGENPYKKSVATDTTTEVITDVKTFRDTPYAYADTMFDSFVKSHNHDPNFRVTTMNREVNCGVEITITYTHTKGML